MGRPIYLDYAATTPVDPRVAEKMSGFLTRDGEFGNPASRAHSYGWRAEAAVEEARQQVAALIGADPREIVWTSGATEANNLALKGCAWARRSVGRHLVVSAVEHKAVLDPCRWLEKQGFEVTYVPPRADGTVAPEAVAEALRPDTVLVSVMHVNNETGAVNDIAAIGALCRERGVPFHSDAAQSAGKLPIDLRKLPVDLMSLSAHKIYGPKGIGALYVRRRPPLPLEPLLHGGGQERGLRAGTLPVHQIVGMGEAFAIAAAEGAAEQQRIGRLAERLVEGLVALDGVRLNGSRTQRLPNICNFSFADVEGETLLVALKDLAVSTGSACTSASLEPSHVLRAMGVPEELAHSSIRISLGRYTTEEEVEAAVAAIARALAALRRGKVAAAAAPGE
ncbi:MAG: cysteine desulfurase IscS [Porticoccaceae bacterium]|nr:MAG: cysteine desulfurase IscS [Porticoccaceae bacterium]